jgi:hypothetical protein
MNRLGTSFFQVVLLLGALLSGVPAFLFLSETIPPVVHARARVHRHLGWSTVAGTVQSSKARWRSHDHKVHSYQDIGTRTATTFHQDCEVIFEYPVNGATLSASTVFLDVTAAQRYPVGAKVTVHYDPSHPAYATLEPGNWNLPWGQVLGGLIGGLLFAAISLAFLWYTFVLAVKMRSESFT